MARESCERKGALSLVHQCRHGCTLGIDHRPPTGLPCLLWAQRRNGWKRVLECRGAQGILEPCACMRAYDLKRKRCKRDMWWEGGSHGILEDPGIESCLTRLVLFCGLLILMFCMLQLFLNLFHNHSDSSPQALIAPTGHPRRKCPMSASTSEVYWGR